MLSALFVYASFLWGCIEGLRRPWLGLVIYYGFVFLEPTWNWRWSIDPEFPFQKYLAICILAGLLLSGIRRARLTGPAFWSYLSLGGFLALAYISSLQSINPARSEIYLDILWKVIFFSLLTVWLIDTPRKLWILLWVIVICQGYNAYQINLYYFQDGFSRFAQSNWGDKGDNNVYSIYTVPVMAMAVSLTAYGRTMWQWALAGSIFVMQMHVLMLLESRGTMIGALVAAALYILLVKKNLRIWKTIIGSVVCGGILAGPSVVEEFSSAFKPRGELDASAESRFDVWMAGVEITQQYPLLGVGPDAGRYMVPAYYAPERDREHKALHNLLFEVSTGCGVPATILYLSFFGFIYLPCLKLYLFSGRQLPDWAATTCLAVACGVPGYWVGSMFSSGSLLESSYVMVALGACTLLMLRRQQEGEVLDAPSGPRTNWRLSSQPPA